MNILGRQLTFKRVQGDPQSSTDSDTVRRDAVDFVKQWMTLCDKHGSDFAKSPQDAMRIDVVNRCVTLIADDIGDLPIHLMENEQDGYDRRIRNHQIINLLRRPNEWQSQYDFKEYLVRSLLLYGNAYVQKIPDIGTDRILRLHTIDPRKVITQPYRRGVLKYKVKIRQQNGRIKDEQLNRDRLIHLRVNVIDPDEPVGVSVIQQAATTIGTAQAQQGFMNALAKTMGIPSGIFKRDPNGVANDPDLADFVQQVKKMRGKPNRLLIPPAGIDFSKISMSASDVQLLMSSRFSRQKIATFFGVPMHKINDTTKTTSFGRGIDSQDSSYARHTLRKWTTVIQQGLTRGLLQSDGPTNQYLVFNIASLLKPDVKTQAQIYAIEFQNGATNPNEYRVDHGKKPYDGGDQFHLMPGAENVDNENNERDNEDNFEEQDEDNE